MFRPTFYIYICARGKKFYVNEYWKYALAFNLPLIPHYLSQMLLIQSDRIMIDRLVGSGPAAIYSVAYNVSLIMSLVTNSLVATYIPSLYSDLKNKNIKDIQDRSLTLNVIVAVLTIVAMLFGPELIKIFATEEYYQAIWIIPPVAMSVFFNSIYSVFVNIEFYYEKNEVCNVCDSGFGRAQYCSELYWNKNIWVCCSGIYHLFMLFAILHRTLLCL